MRTKWRSGGTGNGTTGSAGGPVGVVLVVGAVLSVLGTAELSARGAVETPRARVADHRSEETAEWSPLGIVGSSVNWVANPHRPMCMGLAASVGGIGTDGDDVITGTSGMDVIFAGPGNDVIYGRNGKDVICGGPGNDKLVGGRNPRDWSQAKHGDRLSGGIGDDRITDNWGFKDKLIGGSGDDRLTSSNGTEHVLIGGPGADRLTSTKVYDNAMLGGSGADVLRALSGAGYNRYHFGGPGRDVIDVGPTGDVLVALTGDGDQLTVHRDASILPVFWNSPVGVEVDMRTGTARRLGADPAAPGDVITFQSPKGGIWFLYGSPHADQLNGSDGDDRFSALAGNDTVYGNGGNDFLSGYGGDDFIDGGDGNDNADGGAGTDTCLVEEAANCEP
jgi:Ca2+-binding RTX toxin-like protein